MDGSFWLPQLLLATSFVPALIMFVMPEGAVRTRTTLNLGGALLKVVLVAYAFRETLRGREFEARLPFLPDMDLVLHIDFLALLFATLSAGLWLGTTVYAVGYLEGSPHRSRFFGFFSLCVTATMGIALAGNLATFLIFYELLTVVTYPLIVHRGTGASLAAGRTYLLYTLSGGLLLLVGTVWLHTLVGTADFADGGLGLEAAGGAPRSTLTLIFVILMVGLGVKAALFPLHGWLPEAMVAPAPVSALLHAVAVVKAGAFGIVRVVHHVYGVEFSAALGVLMPLAVMASVTIVYGSLRALVQDDLKRMLAFSTVSQLSYIVLGTALVGPLATIGGIVHLIHQGILKVTLFFCAGAFADTLEIHRISEMDGVARRMPLTMVAFTTAALGMIGMPPTAGFVSKWYLGMGGLAAGQGWVVAVLAASGVLNAAYFLPVLHRAWFRPPARDWSPRRHPGSLEANPMLLVPVVVMAFLALGAGVLAGFSLSPLGLARLAVAGIYAP